MSSAEYPHGYALDDLGPHLLGHNTEPLKPEDWRLEDYVEARAQMTEVLTASTTIQEAWQEFDLSVWHNWFGFYHAVHALNIQPPGPTPPMPPPPTPVNQDVVWLPGKITDQGQTPHCEGYTGLDFGNCEPVNDGWPNQKGHDIYYLCEPGDKGVPVSQQQGSTNDHLCKALRGLGRIAAWASTDQVDTVVAYLRAHGPVGLGIPWTNDMFNPDANAYVQPTGGVAGGHAILSTASLPNGYKSNKNPSIKIPNHWGTSWGESGFFYITTKDLQSLFDQGGTAWAGLELPV